jgi:hypothetical protein
MARDDDDGSAAGNIHRVERDSSVIPVPSEAFGITHGICLETMHDEWVEVSKFCRVVMPSHFGQIRRKEPEKTWVLDLIESKNPNSTSCSSSLAY